MLNENLDRENNQTPRHAPQSANGEFLSLHQASKMTGYHQDYLGQLARSGKLEAHKVGRNWLTTKYAIDKMLGRIKEEAIAPAPIQSIEKVVTPLPVEVQQVPEVPVQIIQTPEVKPEEKIGIKIQRPEPAFSETVVRQEVSMEPEVKSKKVRVNYLGIHENAGPNLQEMLSAPTKEKTVLPKFRNLQTRETYLRWNKLSEGRKSNPVKEYQKVIYLPDKISGMKRIAAYVSAGAVAAFLLAIGINSLSSYFINQSVSEISQTPFTQKRVAGESTEVTSEESSSSSVGIGRVGIGENQIEITNSSITENSVIEISIKSEYKGTHKITSQSPGKFTLALTPPPTQTLYFEYHILNPKNNDATSEPRN
jgi:hypothetical protein